MKGNREILIEDVAFSSDPHMDTRVKNILSRAYCYTKKWTRHGYEYHRTVYRLKTLGDIADLGREELQKFDKLGKGCYDLIESTLQRYGLEISDTLIRATKIEKDGEKEITNMEEERKTEKLDKKPEEIYIEDMYFSVRTYNCLYRRQIRTLADLLEKSEEELSKFKNLGALSIKEITEKLQNYGLKLKENENSAPKTKINVKKPLFEAFKQDDIKTALFSYGDEAFAKNSTSMNEISKTFEEYLNAITKEKADKAESAEDFDRIEEEIDKKREEFKAYVEARRVKFEQKQAFLTKMTAKNSEVKKYHHKQTFEKREGHNFNPFYDDGNELQ